MHCVLSESIRARLTKKKIPTLWLNNNNIQTSSTLYIILAAAAAAAAVHQITKRVVHDVLFRVCLCVRTIVPYRVSVSFAVCARVLSWYTPAHIMT